MESSEAGNAPEPFLHQLLHNKFMMLTVFMAVGGAIYFCVALYMLLRH